MNSKERFMNALLKKDVDRKPVACANQTATVDQMDKLGIYWPEAHKDAEKMAALSAAAWTETGLECIGMPYCQTIESEILGCSLMWSDIRFESDRENMAGAIPAVDFKGFKSVKDITIPDNILESGRIPVVLRALEISAEKYGDEVAILGHIDGPFSLATQLVGPENIFMAMMKDPDIIKEFIDLAVVFATEYGNAMYDHGADVVVVEDMLSTGELLGPKFYKIHSYPGAKELIGKIKGPNMLHICGRTDDLFDDMIATGTNCISIDSNADGKLAAEKANEKGISVSGQVDALVLLNKTPEDIKAETIKSIEAGFDIIAPSCAIPPATPNINLKAMVETVKQ
jgi:MtaA/CmuA family methyltransferase